VSDKYTWGYRMYVPLNKEERMTRDGIKGTSKVSEAIFNYINTWKVSSLKEYVHDRLYWYYKKEATEEEVKMFLKRHGEKEDG